MNIMRRDVYFHHENELMFLAKDIFDMWRFI